MQTSIEVKRVDLWTLFRLVFFLYAAIGLIAGMFYAFLMMVAGGFGEALIGEDIPGLSLITGFLGIILVPVLAFVYGAIGAVVFTIGGALFNLVARVGGGLRFEVALVQPAFGTAPVPAPTVPPVTPPPAASPPPPVVPPPAEPPRYDG